MTSRARGWHGIGVWGAAFVVLALPWRPMLADAPQSLELGAFALWDVASATTTYDDAIVPADDSRLSLLPPTINVAREAIDPAAGRFYMTTIVGGSFLLISADNTPSSGLTAGGALGMAMERANGRVRVEVEGRYRDIVEQTYLGFNENYSIFDPAFVVISQARSYGWSTLANVWRDYEFTDRIDLYGGGGIGAAGFQTEFQRIDVHPRPPAATNSMTAFAWQLGLGAIWNMNERVALDVGYRFFGVGWTATRADLAYGLWRSEVLLSLRIYEPFRGLLR